MPIIETVISKDIFDLVKNATGSSDPSDVNAAIQEYADGMAKVIADAIKSATVTVAAGIPVAAPPPSGIGATTSAGTGSLS